jgi:dsRNA-specific ribonuclease
MDNEEKINDEDISHINGELVFNPYNNKNIEITLNDIQSILKKYGVNYQIYNIELFKRAFIHKSYCKRPILENKASDITIVDKPYDCLPLKTKSNERLEFIGDGILECITKKQKKVL